MLDRSTPPPIAAPPVVAAIHAAPAEHDYAGQPVYDAEPVFSPPPAYQQPSYQQPAAYQQPSYQEPAAYQPAAYQPPSYPEQAAYDMGAPVAGRVPAAMPELPAAGHQPAWGQPDQQQPVWNTPAAVEAAPVDIPRIPRQRADEDHRYDRPASAYSAPAPVAQPPAAVPSAPPHAGSGSPLRRRVPGSQLPAETKSSLPSAPPSQNDAVAARAAFDAFEAGVNRAQWDAVETDMSSPPSAGHAPLARRVPGATLPLDEPNYPPPATPSLPLDPDEARALMEQFEYGVALALNETQPQPEGQPR